jgi:hypothetical protein
MATEATQFDGDGGLAYTKYCGGVFKMTNRLFRAINGYSNSTSPLCSLLTAHPFPSRCGAVVRMGFCVYAQGAGG